MLKKLLIFNNILRQSLFSLKYYRDVFAAPFSFSLKFFLLFAVMAGLFLTVTISLSIFPYVTKFNERLKLRSDNLYPRDLIINLKNGELSTNAPEPIHFPMPYELFFEQPPAISDQKQLFLLTIDTQARPEDLPKTKSLLLLTKNTLSIIDGNDSYQKIPLNELADFTFDKSHADNWLRFLGSLNGLVYIFIPAALLIFSIIVLPIYVLSWLLFMSFILWSFSKIIRLSFSYGKIYQIGLHALMLPTFIQLMLLSLGLRSPIPFFHSILFILFSLVILSDLKQQTRLNNK